MLCWSSKIKFVQITKMKIDILFFASIRELFDKEKISLDVKDDILTPSELLDFLSKNHKGPWLKLLERKTKIRVAVNQNIEDWSFKIRDGDELAFLPPISGG